MSNRMAPWAEVTGYVVPPEVRFEAGDSGGFLVRDQRPVALRLSRRGVTLLRATLGSRPFAGLVELPADPEQAGLLEQIASRGFVRRRARTLDAALPTVAVIVPAFGRPGMAEQCLAALRNQDYPADRLETILVNDASRDGDAEALRAIAGDGRIVSRRVNGGPAAARDTGIRASRSEILAFLDTDCIAQPGWLRRLVLELADPGVGAVAARVRTPVSSGELSRFEAERSPLDMGRVFGDLDARGPNFFVPTANLAMQRSAYEQCGGFSTHLRVGEDVDLCLRLIEHGWRVRYLADPLVEHAPPRRPLDMARRRYAYGRSESFLWERHPVTRQGIRMSLPRVGACLAVIAASRRGATLPVAAAIGLAYGGRQIGRAAGRWNLRRVREPGFVVGRITSVLTNLSRYHATTLLVGEIALRRTFPVVTATCLVGAAACDRATLGSRVPAGTYFALHALEDVAYAWGVAAGAARLALLGGLISRTQPSAGRGR